MCVGILANEKCQIHDLRNKKANWTNFCYAKASIYEI